MTKTASFLEKYDSLSLLEKRFLRLAALLVYVERKGDFLSLLSKAGLKTSEGKGLTAVAFNELLDTLRKKGFLEGSHFLKKTFLHPLTLLALDPKNSESEANKNFIKETLKKGEESPFYIYPPTYFLEKDLRELQLAVYENKEDFLQDKKRSGLVECSHLIELMTILFYEGSLDKEWVESRTPLIQSFLLATKLSFLYINLFLLPPDKELWIDLYKKRGVLEEKNLPSYILHAFNQMDVVLGLLDHAQKRVEKLEEENFVKEEVLGTLAFFGEDMPLSIKHYQKSIKLFGTLLESKEWFRFNIHGFFYFLALLKEGDLKKTTTILNHLKKMELHPGVVPLLEAFLFLKQNNREKALESFKEAQHILKKTPTHLPLILMLMDWGSFLLGGEEPSIKEKFLNAQESHISLAAHFYGELLLEKDPQEKEVLAFMEKTPFKNFRFLPLFPSKAVWEYQIDQLHSLLVEEKSMGSKKEDSSERRLIWLLNPERIEIEALEQKRKENGTWTEGRAVALKRFTNLDPSLDYVTSQDKLAFKGVKREVYGWYGSERYYWDERITLKALVHHPLVFHKENKKIPLELVPGDVELSLEKREKGYFLSLFPHLSTPQIFLNRETPNRYQVIDFKEEAVALAKIIPATGLLLPFGAKEKLLEIITKGKKGIKVVSEVEENLPEIEGDTRPTLHLFPYGEGLKVSLWMRPFKDQGPYVRPGEGQRTLIASLFKEGKEIRQKAIRNFEEEMNSINHLLDNAPSLLDYPSHESTLNELYFDTLSSSLELLNDLAAYQKEYPLLLEWPKGEPFRVKETLSPENLSLRIKKDNHWFEYEGEILLDNKEVLEMKVLLDLLETSPGRFVEIKKGEFIALQESFKKQLEELKALSSGNKVHALSTHVLEDLTQEAKETKGDEEWKAHLQNLKSRRNHNPKVPATLQVNLRDYQEEGFKYLSRLSNWGIGACLADDMGLGKTLQSIALLLEQSSRGPSLVIVPTSLSFTWKEEILRFAPTLNPLLFQESQGREKIIKSLKKRDVLICSYGLLHQEGELLGQKEWQVVILDEAQSIKNKETKRWHSATALKSKSRIALTGTPIENHLGELWSIFHFLNPGLLGSLSSFQQKFWMPIEKEKDPIAKRALKTLISPYLLRRTKSQVLLELPPKTEQTLFIDPSSEEKAFYEALRTKALEELDRVQNPNQKRFKVLAEITKLRQACCDSALIDENLQIPSSKIKTFLDIVKNLKENNHRALVFSQYVGYLRKIKEVLPKENLKYQYLDGSTSSKERQKVIEKFQEGEGDLFLISLKAGGTGLNLTAADYVIILDPWWNPAVEDQASSRSHRMGQERPVTVYRLILKDTIEEKIIKLHQDKRDLADDLLSDTHHSSKLTQEDLLKLIAA